MCPTVESLKFRCADRQALLEILFLDLKAACLGGVSFFFQFLFSKRESDPLIVTVVGARAILKRCIEFGSLFFFGDLFYWL